MLLITPLFFLPRATFATDVQTGSDPVVHVQPSFWDFGPTPLPADHFGPGSDPFDGGVPADATVLPSSPNCPGPLGNTSMLIERKGVAVLPGVPSSDVIDIEIVELSLVSTNPITVTYFGGLNPELWEVEIALSPSLASNGTMTIRQEHAGGGTFDASIVLQPHFSFRRVSDGLVRTLDGAGTWQDVIQVVGVPWVYSAPDLACPSCVSNFVPGHDGVDLVDLALAGTTSLHTVRSACSGNPVPTLSPWGFAAALTLLLLLGGYSLARANRHHRRV